jgi:membrane-associated protease RseP (regulator of RpoE activity)
MVRELRQLRQSVIGALAWLMPLIAVALAGGQSLRVPDWGVWVARQPGVGGMQELIVTGLIEDGPFALAGLREGDRITSVNGRPIDRETQFADAMMAALVGNHPVQLAIVRGSQKQTVSLKASAVKDAIMAPDPLYQAGLLIDERHSDLLIVQRVFPLTPAFYAGLRQADVIASVNGQPMASLAELSQALGKGGNLSVVITRGSKSRQVIMSLGSNRSTQLSRLHQGSSADALSPGALQPPLAPFRGGVGSPPLLAPPTMPGTQSPVPSPPPVVPSLPPPGAVLNAPRL